jgi:hypothetical protein
LLGLFGATFLGHVVLFSTVEAQLLLEATVFLFLGDLPQHGPGFVACEQVDLRGLSIVMLRDSASYLPGEALSPGTRGIVHLPEAVEVSGGFGESVKGGWLGFNTQDLGVQGLWYGTTEGVHLGLFIDPGLRGIVGPFLVPFIEGPLAHVG